MSKAEILEEFVKLSPMERIDLWDSLWTLEGRNMFGEVHPTIEEKTLLDHELETYAKDAHSGVLWSELETRVRNKS